MIILAVILITSLGCVSVLYRENKLRKLLAEEKKKLSSLQKKHTAELARTSELERLLRACVDDVRRDIARRYFALIA
jgi:hypothetical protein